MPRYDFRCRACGETFELSRPMSQSDTPADCPHGHADTVKLVSPVAVGGVAAAQSAPAPAAPSAGGCCGGGCCG